MRKVMRIVGIQRSMTEYEAKISGCPRKEEMSFCQMVGP